MIRCRATDWISMFMKTNRYNFGWVFSILVGSVDNKNGDMHGARLDHHNNQFLFQSQKNRTSNNKARRTNFVSTTKDKITDDGSIDQTWSDFKKYLVPISFFFKI